MEPQCAYIIEFKSLASNLLIFKKGVQYPDYELDKRLARVHGPKLLLGKGYKMSISKSYVVTSHSLTAIDGEKLRMHRDSHRSTCLWFDLLDKSPCVVVKGGHGDGSTYRITNILTNEILATFQPSGPSYGCMNLHAGGYDNQNLIALFTAMAIMIRLGIDRT
ncbi:hypothetical protein E3Q13_01649 [Wallemia mellicola]|nr:hypothetical protein E3Q13_01649 [Wallemia mellicola]